MISENTIAIMKESLEREVKEAVYNAMLKEFLAKAEVEFARIVKPKLAEITFERLERVQNMISIRDELHVFINGGEVLKVKAA